MVIMREYGHVENRQLRNGTYDCTEQLARHMDVLLLIFARILAHMEMGNVDSLIKAQIGELSKPVVGLSTFWHWGTHFKLGSKKRTFLTFQNLTSLRLV